MSTGFIVSGVILLSTKGDARRAPQRPSGANSFRDCNIVAYDPNADFASRFFSEALFADNEDIDAFFVVEASEIPEPATLSLLAAGLTGVGFVAWRRRNRNVA
jgi:hypothetical protein